MPKPTPSKRKQADEDDEDVDDTPAPAPVGLPKPSGSKKKSSKKSTEDDPEQQEQQEIAHEDEEFEQAQPPPPPKKKKAKKAAPEPEPEPEEQEDDDEAEADEEEDEATIKKKAKAKMKRNKKAKLVGYRSLARSAGYIDRVKGDTVSVSGIDGTSCLISIADAKRLMRFTPTTAGSTNFGLEEYTKRHDLFKNGVPASAARETQARCDAALRAAMNQVVLRAAETGKKTISASMMMSVLRPYSDKMLFTAVVPPIGLIRHAQDEGVLNATEKDAEMKAEEKKDNVKTKKICEDYEKAEHERLTARRAKKAIA
jgi:hypothetical protein